MRVYFQGGASFEQYRILIQNKAETSQEEDAKVEQVAALFFQNALLLFDTGKSSIDILFPFCALLGRMRIITSDAELDKFVTNLVLLKQFVRKFFLQFDFQNNWLDIDDGLFSLWNRDSLITCQQLLLIITEWAERVVAVRSHFSHEALKWHLSAFNNLFLNMSKIIQHTKCFGQTCFKAFEEILQSYNELKRVPTKDSLDKVANKFQVFRSLLLAYQAEENFILNALEKAHQVEELTTNIQKLKVASNMN